MPIPDNTALRAWATTLNFTKQAWLVFAFGLLGALAMPPIAIPLFFIVGFAALGFFVQQSPNRKQAFAFGFFYALGFHLAGLYWISESLFVDIARYFWVLPFTLLALPCYLGLLLGICTLLAWHTNKQPVVFCFAFAILVFFQEILRGILLTGFPWNIFGYIWSDNLALLQITSVIGIHGLTLFTLLAAASLTLLFCEPKKNSVLLAVGLWGALSLCALWGYTRLANNPTEYHSSILIRVVQAAIAQTDRRTSAQRLAAFDRTIELSLAPTTQKITHVIWPETASPYFLATNDAARRQLKIIIPKNGGLITGTPAKTDGRYYNSLVLLDDKTNIHGVYDKAHLVPFGEYVPFRNLLKTVPIATDVIGNSADFSSGTGRKTLRLANLPPFSPFICYESVYSGDVASRIDKPEWLLQVTNEAWFGTSSGPYQHFAMVRVRAIEEGLPLVRAANTGISAIIDPLGRTLSFLPLGESNVLDSPLPKKTTGETFFVRYGNIPSLGFSLLLLLGASLLLFRRSKS